MLSSVAPDPPIDGCSVTVAEVIRALSQNHDVTLAFFGSREPTLRSTYDRVVLTPRRRWLRFLPMYWPQFVWGVPFSIFPFTGRAARRQVRRLIGSGRFDAVVCHMVHTAALLPRGCVLPTCMIIQDVVHHAIRGTRDYQTSMLRRAYNYAHVKQLLRYEKQQYPRFGCRTVVSTAEQHRASALNVGDVSVVPNGVDVDEFAPETPIAQRSDIVYLGNMGASRNEDAAWVSVTQVLPLVRRSLPDAKLYVVGARPSERLREVALTTDGIVVTGEVDSVKPFLDSARAFLVPQGVGTGIKTSILQALAMEAPVLASAPAVEGFDGSPGVHYLICSSPDEFATETIRLMTDDELASRLGANGRKLVTEQYSWDNYARRLEELLLGCVANQRSL